MKLKLISIDGSEKGSVDLPKVFSEQIRPDIIKRAVSTIEANGRQAYGAKPDAGMRASANLSRRRHAYRGGYGSGISRVPRKIMSSRGTRFNWVAAVAPGTVGGRRAHPPKSEKIFDKKINAKENRLAIRSALSASLNKEIVSDHGHKVPESYPFIVSEEIENISKTKELVAIFEKLGFKDELSRTSVRKIRAGKGKARGRRKITKRGLLLVTAGNSPVTKSISNILGFEVVQAENLNTSSLAPGGEPGRMVLFSKSAIDKISQEKLFTEERVKKEPKTEKKTEVKKTVKTEKKVSKSQLSKITSKSDVKKE